MSDTSEGLFESAQRQRAAGLAPLAERMRPRSLDEIVGQDHVLGPGCGLREALADDMVPSMILWGPPGSGKTTIARVIARTTQSPFEPFSAVLGGVKEVREIVARAEQRLRLGGRPTVLFVDEIHRFNRAQQDAFLPHMEAGTLTVVGATTENPSFALNNALLSRAKVFVLHPIAEEHVASLLRRALVDEAAGLGAWDLEATDEAIETIARAADGDARRALGTLEEVARHARRKGWPRIDLQAVKDVGSDRALRYDRAGDGHYDLASAFTKSLRGSDPDAAVYYMTRMLESGEDPRFVARRLVVFAAEDVGNADPQALLLATAAQQAVLTIGMPEAAIPLAQATCYCAVTPKSNAAYLALNRARALVKSHGALPIPAHIVNAPTQLMADLGKGRGYLYPHDAPDGFVAGVDYLPDALLGERLYEPVDRGREKALGERLAALRDRSEAAKGGARGPASPGAAGS